MKRVFKMYNVMFYSLEQFATLSYLKPVFIIIIIF